MFWILVEVPLEDTVVTRRSHVRQAHGSRLQSEVDESDVCVVERCFSGFFLILPDVVKLVIMWTGPSPAC